MGAKQAVLELAGVGCGSCAYAIERTGRKLEGVEDIRVDVAAHEVRVSYTGSDEVLDAIITIVRRLGHDARRRAPGLGGKA